MNVEVKAADAEMRHVSPRMADQVITTALSPFVSGAIKGGKTLLGNTAILPQEAFETVAASLRKPEGLNAFQDKGRMYINAGRGDPGTVVHEGIHQYAEGLFLQTFGMFPNEGLTEYFARKAIAEVPEWDIKRSVYIDELALGRKMIAYLGDSVMARVVFDGKLSELQKAYVAKRSEQGRNGEEDWIQLLKAARPKHGTPSPGCGSNPEGASSTFTWLQQAARQDDGRCERSSAQCRWPRTRHLACCQLSHIKNDTHHSKAGPGTTLGRHSALA